MREENTEEREGESPNITDAHCFTERPVDAYLSSTTRGYFWLSGVEGGP